jgi:hypothetical protein
MGLQVLPVVPQPSCGLQVGFDQFMCALHVCPHSRNLKGACVSTDATWVLEASLVQIVYATRCCQDCPCGWRRV